MERSDLEKRSIRVSLAGRVILKRHQGKTTFYVIKDATEKIQLYLNKVLGEDRYLFKNLLIWNLVFCSGSLFKTMWQLTLNCDEIEILESATTISGEIPWIARSRSSI